MLKKAHKPSESDAPFDRQAGHFRPWETDWSDDHSVGDLIRWMWDNQDAQRGRIIEKFLRNLAWLAGDQWLTFSKFTKQMEYPSKERVPSWRVRLVFNFLYGWCEQVVARFIREKPDYGVRAATDEEGDLAVARLQRSLLHSYHYSLKLPRKDRMAFLWNMCCGLVAFKTYFDPFAGPPLVIGEEPLQDSLAFDLAPYKPRGQTQPTAGDICSDYVPAIDLLFYPLQVTAHEDATAILHSREQTAIEIADRYDMDVAEVIRRGEVDRDKSPRMRAAQYGGDQGQDERDFDDSVIMTHEVTLRPHRVQEHYAGRIVIALADGFVLKNMENPYPGGMDPWTFWQEKPVPNQLFGTCHVSELIPAQGEINRDISQMAEHRQIMVRGRWVRIKGDQMQPALTDAPHQIVTVATPNHVPHPMDPPQLGPHMAETRATVERAANFIAASSDATRGNLPPRVRSGEAIQSLQAQDDGRMALRSAEFIEARIDRAVKIITIAQAMIPDERVARVLGESGAGELVAWNKYKLRPSVYDMPGIGQAVDVFIENESLIGQNKHTRRQILKEMTEVVAKIQDPHLRRQFIRGYDMGDETVFTEEHRIHTNRQYREIERWKRGMPPQPPRVQDDDESHIEVLLKWMNGDEYETLTASNPQLDFAAKMHLEQHRQAAEDKRVADEFRMMNARMRNAVRFNVMTQGAFPAPIPPGVVDGSDSANRPGERGQGGPKRQLPPRPPQAPAAGSNGGAQEGRLQEQGAGVQ